MPTAVDPVAQNANPGPVDPAPMVEGASTNPSQQASTQAGQGGTPNPTPGINPITSESGASLAGTIGADAITQEIDPATLSSNLVTDMTSRDSRYMESARSGGERQAQSRGLLNSSLSAGAAEGAAIDRAGQFALQDSQSYLAQAMGNQTEMNASERFNANALNAASIANAGFENQLIAGERDTANTLEVIGGQSQAAMEQAAQNFGFETALQATEAGFTEEQLTQQEGISMNLASQRFGFENIQMALQSGLTIEELLAQGEIEAGLLEQQRTISRDLAAQSHGFATIEMALQSGLTIEQLNAQGDIEMEQAAQAFGFDTALSAQENGFTLEQLAAQAGHSKDLAAQAFGFDTALQATEAGFTMEQIQEQGVVQRENAAQMFGFDTELQATAAGFSMAELQESGAISMRLAAQSFGFDTELQATEAGFTKEQIAQQGQIEMDLALDAFGFDTALAAQQGGIDLGLIAATAQDSMDLAAQAFGFETSLLAQEGGLSIDQIRERGAEEAKLLAQQAGFDDARLALQNGYTLDQMKEQATLDDTSRAKSFEHEKLLETQRQTGAIDLQDVKNGAALDLANIEAEYRQAIALNASASEAFKGYQQSLAQVYDDPDMTPAQVDAAATQLRAGLRANLQVISDIGGIDLTSYIDGIDGGGTVTGQPVDPGRGPGSGGGRGGNVNPNNGATSTTNPDGSTTITPNDGRAPWTIPAEGSTTPGEEASN